MEHEVNHTLDPIRPSDCNGRGDISYLFARDPSILAYGQRPCVSKDTKKNLLSLYEMEEDNTVEICDSINSESQPIQTVKVYLRMKPFPKKMKLTEEQQNAYKIMNLTTLFTRLPTVENNTSCLKRSNSTDVVCRKYTFTKTFAPETTQLELFEEGVKEQMSDFLTGQNCTIMTYGTTNSGKSYTLQGTTTSPGIVPRCLEYVFSNITSKSTPSYKPIHNCDVVSLDPLERAQELEIKTKLLTFASVDKHQYINAYREMQKLLQDESPIRPSQCNDAHYSIWVSFAEIYNEIVYDLLSHECQKKRTPLKLVTDSQGRAFIKGLKTICVNSGSEAYQVLMAGQYNLKVAATALNARSSRSHCIFTIKLLKYYVENDPDSVEVSTFAFCDLAGSERLKKTLNIGDRLKEAQNINTSLLVLGRCLKTIYDGQITKHKIEHIGPFRESKLTRLFQKALSGKEQMVLIVNINPIPNLYIETQNVLSFSAIAKKIVIEEKEKVPKKMKSRFSQIVTQSIKTVTDWDVTELESEEWQNTVNDDGISRCIQPEDYDELITENERLKEEIANLKSSALSRDLQIRQEMADTYTAMMKNLEAEWKNRIKDVEEQQEDALQWSVRQVEEYYKEKLYQINNRKRRRSDYDDDDFELKHTEELELENSRLTSKIVILKNNFKEIKEENEILAVEKNKACFELGLMKEELKTATALLNTVQKDIASTEDTNYYIEELRSQLSAKQEQVKKLKVFLNEAKEEYIAITGEMEERKCIIKEQEEELFEKQETIDDLEAQFSTINICLTEKTKSVEILEEKLENQKRKLMDTETKRQEMQKKINKLECENSTLIDTVESLKQTVVSKEVEPVTNGKQESTSDVGIVILDATKNGHKIKDENKHDSEDENKHDSEDENKHDSEDENEHENKNINPLADAEQDRHDKIIGEKIIAIEQENSTLKDRIIQSTGEIQSLKEELESAKLKLKNISEQLCNLKIDEGKGEILNDDDNKQKEIVETMEIGCQVHIESKEQETNTLENDVFNKSSQTAEYTTTDESNQTSFIQETDDTYDIVDESAKLLVKYHDLKEQNKEKSLEVENLKQELIFLKERIERLMEENTTNRTIIEEYKDSVILLQNELSVLTKDKIEVDQELQKHENAKIALENKIKDYELQFEDTKKELVSAKDSHTQCVEKLNTVQSDFDSHLSKCKDEHEQRISNLQKELSVATEKCDIKSQCLDVHAAKITELEHNLESVTELQQQIEELNRNFEACQCEKDRLQRLLDENNDRLLELEDRLENAEEKERDKDAEIISLQKEMKHMIQRNHNDNQSEQLMESEMKSTIRDLTETKQMLSQKLEYIEQLETQAKNNEHNAKILDLLQQSAQERQTENQRLRKVNEELKNSLVEKEHEMETFMKNRDDMVRKYETLVQTQQEELEKQKQEITKDRGKEKDCETHTSEDEAVHRERRLRRPPKKYMFSPPRDEISVIELSGSESKKSSKRGIFPTPQTEPSSERKKNTRKKKLYVTGDEPCQEIEPLESTTVVTPTNRTRILRNRRK